LGEDALPEPEAAAYLIELGDLDRAHVELADTQVEPNTSAEQPKSSATRSASEPARRKSGRKGGRPNVPAWDEIMFGSRPGVDRSSS